MLPEVVAVSPRGRLETFGMMKPH